MKRRVPPVYQDGRSVPRGGRHPSSLPNPRWISQKNHPDSDIPDPRYTHMVMQFGQFLDHDITLTPEEDVHDCCSTDVVTELNSQCYPIHVGNQDTFYSSRNVTCLDFSRYM